MGRFACIGWSAGCAALLAACAPHGGGWSWRALEARHPIVGELGGAHLADATPYFLPTPAGRGAQPAQPSQPAQWVLFLCRFSTEAPISVSLPSDATDEEQRLLRLALAAWAGLGVGLEFEERPGDGTQITIRFIDQDGGGGRAPRGSADTSADCALPPLGVPSLVEEPVPARIVRASIHLRRTQPDSLGRSRSLSPEELLGAALHELGHALGFQGHAAAGRSIMVRDVDQVRRIGRLVLSGEPWVDSPLRTLYSLPSGTEVARRPLAPATEQTLSRLAVHAAANGWSGPFARVGDHSALLFWRDAQGEEVALRLLSWRKFAQGSTPLSWQPNPRASQLLREVGGLSSGGH